jgi:hypothetical protein
LYITDEKERGIGRPWRGTLRIHCFFTIVQRNRTIVTSHFASRTAFFTDIPRVKAEKYLIVTEFPQKSSDGSPAVVPSISKIRFGFGAAGEEVQKLLTTGAERVRVRIEGMPSEATFVNGRLWRLLDIKQRLKGLSADDD